MPDIAPDAMLEALRGRGADRFDPVRFRFLEAFARRADGHAGAARRVLDATLARRVAAYQEDARTAVSDDTARGIEASAPVPGPLAALAAKMARTSSADARGEAFSPTSAALAAAARPADMKALTYLRQTWARLSVEQRLAQSLSALPGNAGPLNSHQLVHRALTLMREISPAYLDRFVAYTDALLWVEQTLGAGMRAPAKETTAAPRAPAAKKAARGR